MKYYIFYSGSRGQKPQDKSCKWSLFAQVFCSWKLLVLVCGASFLSVFSICGCATLYNPATGRNELILIDTQTEINIGKNVAKEVVNRTPLSQDPALNARVKRIGGLLASVSDRKDIVYSFYVLNSQDFNAISVPGGFIYAYKGLLEALNDDELAFVLGHEVAHLAARHAIKNIQANMAYSLLMQIALTGVSQQNAMIDAQNISQGVNTIYNLIELGYSRHDEFEADKIGMAYAFRAGFSSRAALSALAKIKAQEGSSGKVMVYFRTHPYTEDRIKALEKIIP